MPSFLPSFTLPPGSMEYPYDLPTAMMVGLQTNATTYVDNAMYLVSPINTYLVLGSSISNPSRIT